MTVKSNSSNKLDQNFIKSYFGFTLPSNSSAKRDFSNSVQAALGSGLTPRDLQNILDSVINNEITAKEAQ